MAAPPSHIIARSEYLVYLTATQRPVPVLRPAAGCRSPKEKPRRGMPGFPDGTTNMGGTRSSPEHDMGWIVLRSILLMAELIVITMK